MPMALAGIITAIVTAVAIAMGCLHDPSKSFGYRILASANGVVPKVVVTAKLEKVRIYFLNSLQSYLWLLLPLPKL